MPKLIAKMPVKKIEQLPAGLHAVAPSLYAAIGASGSRSWIFRYTTDGKKRDMGIGSFRDLSRDDAEREVERLRELRRRGIDPIQARRDKAIDSALRVTFEQAGRAYYRANQAAWSVSHRRAWLANLEAYAFPILGAAAVDKITVRDVLAVVEPIWTEKHDTASRLRGAIEKVLDQAKALHQRTGENPAQWKGNLDAILPAPRRIKQKVHLPAMPWQEVPAFVAQLPDTDAGRALEFLILTATRSNETRDAAWSEIDFTGRTWTIPATRMKARREHVVPLTTRALAILLALPRRGDLVFGELGRDAMIDLVKAAGRYTTHGFRAAFSTWAGERTSHPRDIVERVLAHATGSQVEQAYRRGAETERRLAVLEAWEKFVADDEPQGAVVVDFRRA